MDYIEYKAARDLSWEVLLKNEIKDLPVSVHDICCSMGIALKSYSSTDGNHGFCNIIGGKPYIFVDSNCERGLKRYTAAHELGHILLGHVGEFMHLSDITYHYSGDAERSADRFAMCLLAPACVLWGCGVDSAEKIVLLCDINREAAECRMERMKRLYARNKFLTAPEEKEVYEKFWPFIYRFRQASGK